MWSGPVAPAHEGSEFSAEVLRVAGDVSVNDWQFIVLHHSGTVSGSVESIHNDHRERKDRYGNAWLGIGYHFVIGNGSGMPDGEIVPTFRWKQQIHGAHSGSSVHNSKGIGVCLIGNFQDKAPTQKQLKAVIALISELSQQHQISRSLIIGHNSVKPTACPGKNFPLHEVVRDSFSDRTPAF